MNELRAESCSTRLASLLKHVDLQDLSRIPALRLRETALPNIGLVELVSAESFEESYQSLYLSMFHGGERERPELIVERLRDDSTGRRSGLAPYHIVGIRDHHSAVIGAAQFSVLALPGTEYTIPYLQYIYVRPANRRQDISEVLHTFVLAVTLADARATGAQQSVPFTLFETDPPNYGTSQSSRAYATERTNIHTRSGSKAIMLIDESGTVSSSHVQPGLDPGDQHVTLIWVVRPSPSCQYPMECDVGAFGTALLAAYYRSLRDEGFPEPNIALAEEIANRRCQSRQFIEMPLAEITSAMYQNLDDGPPPEMVPRTNVSGMPSRIQYHEH